MKTAVIDPGGGLRSVYASGVFDYLIDQKIDFDFGIGVSAGAANLCSFQAGQKMRNHAFYVDYSRRPEYMSVSNFIKKKSFFDFNYIYSDLSNSDGEYPLDFSKMMANPAGLTIIATNALTGRPVYFDKSRIRQDHYEILKATCSLPVLCQPSRVHHLPCFDGACSDPMPVKKALELGADRLVIILSQPRDVPGNDRLDRYASRLLRKYPKAARALRSAASKYNEGLQIALELEKQGRALIVAPDSSMGVHMVCRDPIALHTLYLKGYADGVKIREFISGK